MSKIFNKWVKGVYRFRTPEQVLRALRKGKEVMIKGYGYSFDDIECMKNFTGIYIEDFEGDTDKEILDILENKYSDWQLWN